MNQTPDQAELLRRLRKPLAYLRSLDPHRAGQVIALEKTLAEILRPPTPAGFAPFLDLIPGLDALSGPDRLRRVDQLLAVLDRIEAGGETDRRETEETERTRAALKELDTDVQWVKGVGPWVADKLLRLEVRTVGDLLLHLPARYEDRRGLKRISEVKPGERVTVAGEVMVCGESHHRGQRRYQLLLSDGAGAIALKWFNYVGDYLERRFQQGQRLVATEVVRRYGNELELHHPEVEVLEGEDDLGSLAVLAPVYPLTEGLTQRLLRRVTANALEAWRERMPEILPAWARERRGLLNAGDALAAVHAPPLDADFEQYNGLRSPGHRRLAYEEFFLLELGIALRRRGMVEEPAPALPGEGKLLADFRAALPFTLTASQEKVTAEILADLQKPRAMHRLLQGDVGSGKTVVAVMAALAAIAGGRQAALMAPTEILAEQHHRNVGALVSGLGVRVELLTGAVKGPERARILAAAAAGRVDLLIGTHALIQDQVDFQQLALGIVDEQHRFGVLQRAKLKAKAPPGLSPHLLVMTATPIPRSLAMTVYGDLAVSVIRELPPGRRPVTTRLYRENERAEAYAEVRKEVEAGRQVFIVFPLVEESDKLELRAAVTMAEQLRDRELQGLRIGLIHGRLRSEEKEAVMLAFAAGSIDVLIATTVVEVGIDVKNASLMVIEHAERFGLSQLHQLRGRVGRGEHLSRCCLVAGGYLAEDAWRRVKTMERTCDGFAIAEEDLALRGPGEFFGTRQWGLPDLRVASLIRDADTLTEAREDAFELVRRDPRMELPEHRFLLGLVRKRWGKRLRLGSVG